MAIGVDGRSKRMLDERLLMVDLRGPVTRIPITRVSKRFLTECKPVKRFSLFNFSERILKLIRCEESRSLDEDQNGTSLKTNLQQTINHA